MEKYNGGIYQNESESEVLLPLTQVKTFQWEQVGVEYFYYPGDLFLENTHSKIQITTPFTPSNFRSLWQTAGGFGRTQNLEEEAVCLIVSDQPHALQWENYGEFASFYLTPQHLHYCVHDLLKGDSVELVESFGKDPLLWQLGLALRHELRQPDTAPSQLFVESLINVASVHLLRNYGVRQFKPLQKEVGALSKPLLKQLVDYIEVNLKEDLSLAELSGLTQFSLFHLARSFKKATGLSIHRYILERRVERAKILLATTNLTLSDICAQVGFSNQSHFTTQFRRFVALTPKIYRLKTQKV